MASFTDAIPQFNPYIQQLPVEAMVAVGMEKQQRYDQGVQRIQSQIDQVAGLSISRPQDRQYLQSKLNDLGSKLKTVAAGDFSNYQLVNSVAGMAGSLIKDPTIIASVQSTAQRKAIQDKRQKDIDSGNYNPANNYLYELSDNEWFNDPNVGASYTGYYKTPVDVWGKIKDIAKEVGIDERVVPNLFETDESGRIKRAETGNALLNTVTVEETFEGKDASKILSAFQNALNPSDYEQLSIEGRYNYRGISPEQLQKTVASSLDKDITLNNGKIEFLKLSLAEEENKAKTNEYDEALIKSLKDEIKYFEGRNIQIEKSKKESLDAIATNPESAKAKLYTENYLSSMSEVLSSKAVSKKYSINPHFEVSMKINEFERQQTQWLADYNLRLRADNRAQKEYEAKAQALAAQAAYFQAGGVDTPINADPAMVRAMVEGGYSESVTQYNTIANTLALETLRMANPGDTEEQLKKKLYDAAAYRGQTNNPNSGEINETAKIMASGLQTLYRTNPDKVPKTLHGLIAQADKVFKSIESQRSVMQKAQQDAREAASLQGVDMEAYDKVVRDVKPTSVTVNGQSVNLSQQDLIDFINLNPQMYNTFGNLTVDRNQEMLRNQAQIRLGAKFGSGLEDLKSVLYPMQYQPFSERKRPAPSQLLQGIADRLGDAKDQDYNKFLSDAYQKNGAVPVGKIATIDKGDQKTEDYRNKFIAVLSKYELDLDEDVYNNLSNAVLSDAFGATVTTMPGVNLESPSTYTLKITGKDGSSEMIEIERNDYRFLTGFEPPANPNLKNAFDLLNARGTTNLSKSGEYSTAYFKTQDFTNFNSDKYSLMGDLEEDALDPNIVYPRIYIFDKNENSLKKSFIIGDVALPKIINGQINPQLEAFSGAVTAQFIKETTNFPIY